jgi:hypothetical protein
MPELPNVQHETFAGFVAQGLSLTQAAKRAGYIAANNSGSRVAQLPAVAARIEELRRADGTNLVCSSGVRSVPARVTAIEQRWIGMRTIIAERAADPEMQTVPGGRTGLLTVSFKQLGSGKDATIVKEYKVDAPLLYELRAHEQLIAEELGQRTKVTENRTLKLTGTIGDKELNEALRQQLGSLSDEERKALASVSPELHEIIDAVPQASQGETVEPAASAEPLDQ